MHKWHAVGGAVDHCPPKSCGPSWWSTEGLNAAAAAAAAVGACELWLINLRVRSEFMMAEATNRLFDCLTA